ncbi:MAG: adenylosuccinate synthase [Gemmataceae bacterium]
MRGTCVVGLQWGDEAKGKIVDLLSDQHDFVVRYNGGANAGHTVVWGDRTFKLSLLPTGILKPHVCSVIGNGLVVYPPRFQEEVEQLKKAGVPVGENLRLSDHAHVIFPYHMEEERLAEGNSSSPIGTTGRGIGPCYQDKIGRRFSIRVGDLLRPDHLRKRLSETVPHKNKMLAAMAGTATAKQFSVDDLMTEYLGYAEFLRPHVTDTVRLLHDGLSAGKAMLFEAAQGSLLDVDHGSYPYVTSSSSLPSGIWPGCGVPSRHLDRIIGIVKAYTTRVGQGPFPTELNDGPDGLGERIRKIGREYGTVTGRPRRVGWLDTVALRYTAALASVDELSVMLLDVLSGLDELRICTAYEYRGERIPHFLSDSVELAECTPVYETVPGWHEDLTQARTAADLPRNARAYLDRIQELVGKPVTITSVGPDRAQTIALRAGALG